MSLLRRLVTFSLLPLGLAGLTPAALAKPLNQVLPQFDKDVEAIFGRYNIPAAAVAVVENGKVVYVKTLGTTDRKNPHPVDEHTIFRLASVSKTFAAVLAGQAMHEHKLGLHDPISKFIPGFRLKYDRQNKLDVEMVLSHQGGLPHNAYDDLIEAGQPYDAVLRRLETLDPVCLVGKCFSYQNVLYSTIGNALEKSTGQSYENLIQTRIFNPLGMRDSGASLAHFQHSDNAATPHIMTARGWWPKEPNQYYYEVTPAAGVNASIHDMSQYLLAVMGHRPDVIPAPVMDELTTPRVSSPKEGITSKWRKTRIKKPMYGLGWRIFQYDNRYPMIFHAGGLSGVRSRLGWLPGKDIGIVMLWNANESKPEVLLPMLFDRVLDLPSVDYLELPKSAPTKKASAKKAKTRKATAQKAGTKKPVKKTSKKKTTVKKPAAKKTTTQKKPTITR